MIAFLAQSKKLWKVLKSEINYQITFVMFLYWLLINLLLLIPTFLLFETKILIGFNVGALGCFLGFFVLAVSAKWLVSQKPFLQALAYMSFLIRMLIYGLLLGLVIHFQFANLISTVLGFWMLMLSAITSEIWFLRSRRKENHE